MDNMDMDTKKTNGWILCPSKRFPGNFYYFNVLSGETAWSISDTQAKMMKKDNSFTVTDSHNYPEPTSPSECLFKKPAPPPAQPQPPKAKTTNTSAFNHTLPVFGQATFPKPLWECIPKTIYVLMPLQMPVVNPLTSAQEEIQPKYNDMNKSDNEYITEPKDRARQLLVQSSGLPLCKRIVNYKNPVLKFDEHNKLKVFETSTPNKGNFSFKSPIKEAKLSFKSPIKEAKLSFKSPIKEANLSYKSPKEANMSFNTEDIRPKIEQKIVKDAVLNLPEKKLKTADVGMQKSPVSMVDKCCSPITVHEGPSTAEVKCNDLRMFLLAKKRKSMDMGDCQIDFGFSDGKKIKLTKQEEDQKSVVTKKKVTFKLDTSDVESSGNYSESQDDLETENQAITIHELRNLCAFNGDVWYILIDMDTLLEEYEFIENYVQTDPSCRLLLPPCLRSSLSRAALGGVTAARGAIRRLTAAYVENYSIDQEIWLSNEPIINCCLQVMKEGSHVVLITNEENLQREAKSHSIHCYTINQIKNGVEESAGITFDIRKIKITVNNETSNERQFDYLKNKNFDVINQDLISENSLDSIPGNDYINENAGKTEWRSCNSDESDVTDCLSKDLQHLELIDSRIAKEKADTSNFFYKNTSITNNKVQNRNISQEKLNQSANMTQISIPYQVDKQKQPLSLNDKIENQITSPYFSKTTENLSSKFKNVISQEHFESTFKNDIKETFFSKTTENSSSKFKNDIKEKAGSSIFDIDSDCKLPVHNLNEFLMRFYVKTKILQNKLIARTEEIICIFRQIMEESLSDFLQNTSKTSTRFSLYDSIQKFIEMYECHTPVKNVIERLYGLMYTSDTVKDKMKNSFTPKDVIQIMGCGLFLVIVLKNSHPNETILNEAEKSMKYLINRLESDDDDVSLQRMTAVSRIDINDVNGYYENRRNFVKNRADIIEYLKKHFSSWKEYNEQEIDTKKLTQNIEKEPNQVKVLRTYGKNLNLLKLNRAKSMVMIATKQTENTELKTVKSTELITNKKDTEENQNVKNDTDIDRSNDNDRSNENKTEPKVIRLFKNVDSVKQKLNFDLNETIHGNTFADTNIEAGPKMIRNIVTIREYEDKIRNKSKALDLYKLDFGEISSDDSTQESVNLNVENDSDIDRSNDIDVDRSNDNQINNDYGLFNDNYTTEIERTESENYTKNNKYTTYNGDIENYTKDTDYTEDSRKIYDDMTNDSGIEDSQFAYPMVISMFTGLSSSFLAIHKLINETNNQFRKGNLKNDTKKDIGQKALKARDFIKHVIDNIQKIIKRESEDTITMKSLLLRTGIQDIRATRYSQVLTKCMETARILENGLNIIETLCFGGNDLEAVKLTAPVTHINIFE